MEEKILASLVIEILGRPKEHVKEALNTLVVKLGSEQGVTITNKILHDPQPVKDSKTLYTSFAEVDVELESAERYFAVIFTYLPSHIELIHPEKIILSNSQLNDLGNALTQRLHHYDAITKNVLVEKETLVQKLREVAPHLFSKEQHLPQQKVTPKKQTKKLSKKKKKS